MRKNKLINFLYAAFIFMPLNLLADTIPANIVQQKIVYQTTHASEVIIVWALNEWQAPALEDLPSNSYIKDELAYTTMKKAGDSFTIYIPVKEKSYLHYMFWLSKDKKGIPSNNWDTYNDENYNLFVRKGSEPRFITSVYDLYNMTSDFNVLTKAGLLAIGGGFILLVSLLLYYKKLKYINPVYLFTGFLLASFIIMLFIRLQLNKLYTSAHLLFGAGYYDLVFLLIFCLIGAFLLFLIKQKFYRNILTGFLLVLILVITTIALFNIEIIKQIGHPFNYQWFYYSGFLQSADAKNALDKSLSYQMIKSFIYILTGLTAAGIGFALLMNNFNLLQKRKWIILLFPFIILCVGFVQKSNSALALKNIQNPIVSFATSWINSGKAPLLFSMEVPQENKKYINELHSQLLNPDSITFPGIKHIVLFVLESTPAEYISVYNNQFNVTPNLEKWRAGSRIFTNIYAHIPATPKSLFSMVSGVYSNINYKSVTDEKPDFNVMSINRLLKKDGWLSAGFFAADLNFSNMGNYLNSQKFDTVKDIKNIDCSNQGFVFNYSNLDGIDDQCMTRDYMNWLLKRKDEKTFSILWTMQTHHPYSFNEKEITYAKSNNELNKYLNALKHDDEAFGYLMEQLKNANIINETLVIITGDHGEAFGRHNQFTHASNIYEENLHVPCIMINPLLFKGEKDDRIGGLIDIPATIAKITGNKIPDEWQGRSLFDSQPKEQVFFFSPYSDFLFGTRKNNWKLIFNASTNSYELYDLAIDPQETINLADKYPGIVKAEYLNIAAWVQYQNAKMKDWLKK